MDQSTYIDSQDDTALNDSNALDNTRLDDSDGIDVTDDQSFDIIIDDGETGTIATGSWGKSGGTEPFGSSSLYSKDRGAEYIYEYPLTGNFDVFIWWSGYKSRCSKVPVEIYDGKRLLETNYIDQSQNSGQWFNLGNYFFSEQARIVITAQGNWCSTCADAIRISK